MLGGAMFTELGSPIGTGLADWDLEAFWRERDKGQEAADARAERVVENAIPASPPVDPTFYDPASLPNDPASLSDDEETFWDAASNFSEDEDEDGEGDPASRSWDDEGLGEPVSQARDGEGLDIPLGLGVPVTELLRGKVKEVATLSPLSLSGSEDELDRWMLGSRSQTTEESTHGSAASSTLDASEWTLLDPGEGGSAAGEGSPWIKKELPSRSYPLTDRREPTGQDEGENLGDREPTADPVPARQEEEGARTPAADPVRGPQATAGPLLSPLAALPSGRNPGETGFSLDQQCLPADGAGSGPGERREDLGLITDADLARLLDVFAEEEPDMVPGAQRGATAATKQHTAGAQGCEEARPSARAGPASPGAAPGGLDALEATPSSSSSSSGGSKPKKGKGSTNAGSGWRLLMRRNSELMQYSSWVRDRGRHFGAMEFRGRMLLLPKPAGPTQQAGAGQPSAPKQRWGAGAVRDFLLDELHRAEWDESREVSAVLEEWDESGSSMVRWVRRLPLFLRSREYVVGRRVWSPNSAPGVYYCVSKSTEHAAAPKVPSFVRVSSFFSSWRVRALSAEETEHERQELASSGRQGGGGQGKGNRKSQKEQPTGRSSPPDGSAGGSPGEEEYAEAGEEGVSSRAVEIITHHEEESGLPRDLVRMGVAHGMWGHMLKMEQALRNYCAAGRTLPHPLPLALLQAEHRAQAEQPPAEAVAQAD